jgi:diaminopimelate epimerase
MLEVFSAKLGSRERAFAGELSFMDFAKLHGLGNDFLVAQANKADGTKISLASLATDICDRHRGVGADGIIFYEPTVGDPEAEISALIFNADGSKAEMSGNGIRCLAAFLHYAGFYSSSVLRIRTVSGVKRFSLKEKRDCVYIFESSMGRPITDPILVPARLDSASVPIINRTMSVGSGAVQITVCSMGNPHCSTFWQDLENAPIDVLGPQLEGHSAFPNRTNVEFIQVLDRHKILVKFWERGVGRTLASGTGGSAAAVASILNGFAESPLTVQTELGNLFVVWNQQDELLLTGSAEFICSGVYVERSQ